MKRLRATVAAMVVAALGLLVSPGVAFAEPPATGKWYTLSNTVTGYYLAVSQGLLNDGRPVVQWTGPFDGNGDYRREQEWRVYDPDGDGWFNLINLRSEKALGVSGGATANGGKLIQWARQDSNLDQQWTFRRSGTDRTNNPIQGYRYHLVNRKSSRCLAIAGGNAGDSLEGQQAIIYDCHTAAAADYDDQTWSPVWTA